MDQQTFGNDVQFGDELGPVTWCPDYNAVFDWLAYRPEGGAEGGNRFLDADVARAQGLAGPIVPGTFMQSNVIKLLTDWYGPRGWLRTLNVNFRRSGYHDDALRCYALVTDTREEGDQTIVKLDVFLEDVRGERPIQGVAEVAIPTRP